MILTRTPKCVSQRANTRPVGPAPMMSTSVSTSAAITHDNDRTAKAPKRSRQISMRRRQNSCYDKNSTFPGDVVVEQPRQLAIHLGPVEAGEDHPQREVAQRAAERAGRLAGAVA